MSALMLTFPNYHSKTQFYNLIGRIMCPIIMIAIIKLNIVVIIALETLLVKKINVIFSSRLVASCGLIEIRCI